MKTNADLQREVYDRHTPLESTNANIDLRLQIIHEFANALPSGDLLDIGCSDGTILQSLNRHRLNGVDISEVAVAFARERGINAHVANVEDGLPFADDAFDIVVAGEVLEHVVRTDFLLHEVNRVLRPGGHFIVTCPNVNNITSLAMMVLLDFPPYASARYRSPHVRDFTARTLKMALGNHGFEARRIFGTGVMLPKIGLVLHSLGRLIPRVSPMMICLAQKTNSSVFDSSKEIEFTLSSL